MVTSRYKCVFIKQDNGQYFAIDPDLNEPYIASFRLPIYSSDFILSKDRMAEYELIKHLTNAEIVAYFLQDINQ